MIVGFNNMPALLLLPVAALLAVWYVFGALRARRDRAAFADPSRIAPSGLASPGIRAHAAPALLIIAAVLASLAVARPMGPPDKEASGSAAMDVIVALDVSDSMAVPDADTDRLTAAKKAIAALVQDAPANRYGLVLFSGEAVVSCPLTVDHDAFLTFLDGATFARSGLPGTALGEAVLTASTRFRKDELPRAVVVVSDGENTYGADPYEAASSAAGMGLRVYTLGVGTKEGGPIPVGRDFFGKVMYKQDRAGRTVNSALDGQALGKVAASGGGKYFHAGETGSVKGLAGVLKAKDTKEVKGIPPDAKELGPYFALAAFALVTVAMIL